MDSCSVSDHRLLGHGQNPDDNEHHLEHDQNQDDSKHSDYNKRARLRQKVLKEITDTEATYQSHLQLLVQNFEEPLRCSGMVPDHVAFTIFSNLDQLVNVNKELSRHLQSLSLGQAFLNIAPFLKLYSTYANNHERALATLMEWDQKSGEFAGWRRLQEDKPEMEGLKLNALLIMPVQRIPRYKLLLEELLQYTEESHTDRQNIEEAVVLVSEVAQHINEHIRQQDNCMKMIAIQRSLAGSGAPRVLVPGRIFLKEGLLKKVSKKGGRSYERMFFLFSDILIYAKPKLLENTIHQGAYSCCCILPLHHCTVSRVFGHGQGAGSLFTISCKNESFLLYSDQKSVDTWIEALEAAISAICECRKTLKKPSSAKLPLRKSALVRLKKREKKADPLQSLGKRTPEKCSPQKRKRLKSDDSTMASPSPVRPSRHTMNESSYRSSNLLSDDDILGSSRCGQLSCLSPARSHHLGANQGREGSPTQLRRRGQDLIACLSPSTRFRTNESIEKSHMDSGHRESASLEYEEDEDESGDAFTDYRYEDSDLGSGLKPRRLRPMSAITELSEDCSPGSRSFKPDTSVLSSIGNVCRGSIQGNQSTGRNSKHENHTDGYHGHRSHLDNYEQQPEKSSVLYGKRSRNMMSEWHIESSGETDGSNEEIVGCRGDCEDEYLWTKKEIDLSKDSLSFDDTDSPMETCLGRPPLRSYVSRSGGSVTGCADLGDADHGFEGISCGDGCDACLLDLLREQEQQEADIMSQHTTPPGVSQKTPHKTPVKRTTQQALDSALNSVSQAAQKASLFSSPSSAPTNNMAVNACVLQ